MLDALKFDVEIFVSFRTLVLQQTRRELDNDQCSQSLCDVLFIGQHICADVLRHE